MNSEENNNFFTLPNILTLLRILLVPLFLIMILTRKAFEALLIFLLAGLTDILDGFSARLWHQKTKIGAILDPAADKLLMSTSYVILSFPSLSNVNTIPIWLTGTVIGRDVLISIGFFVIYLTKGKTSFSPSILGKGSTVCQVGTVLLVLLSNYFNISPSPLNWLYVLTFVITVMSGIHYSIVGFGLIFLPQRS
ncbi:MAG: CDP-alcohol phosphatidyltransferase family protein [Candidatus Aminicenantaceae bacterium]